MTRPLVSIVIVSWNGANDLARCFAALKKMPEPNSEIIIVDNHSSDATAQVIRDFQSSQSNYLTCHFIQNLENRGFATANNQGLKLARGEYVLLLNPDTEVFPDTLERMVNFFHLHPEAGLAGCRLLNSDGTLQPSVRRLPDFWSQFLMLLKLHHLVPGLRVFKNYLAADFDYSKTQLAEQVMGAFFMLPMSTLKTVGALDEKFFLWFEEVDYCQRVHQAGLKIYFVAEARCVHYGGQSFQQVRSLCKQMQFNSSRRRYFRKYGSRVAVFLLWLFEPISWILTFFGLSVLYRS